MLLLLSTQSPVWNLSCPSKYFWDGNYDPLLDNSHEHRSRINVTAASLPCLIIRAHESCHYLDDNMILVIIDYAISYLTALNVKMLPGDWWWDRIKAVEVSQLGRHEAEGGEGGEKTQREHPEMTGQGRESSGLLLRPGPGLEWEERGPIIIKGGAVPSEKFQRNKQRNGWHSKLMAILRDRPRMNLRTMASFVLYCPITYHYIPKVENVSN